MTALTIFTPRAGYYQQTSVVGNLFSLKMLAAGGQTPYYWSFPGPAFAIVGSTTGTNYALPLNGWLSCAAISAGADTFTVLVTDNNGATATQSVTITHTASGLTFYPLDLISATPTINLPPAAAQTPYSYQFKVAGGTGIGRVFTIVSGALPSGLGMSSSGLINGVPSRSGSISGCQVKCTDSANNTQTVSLYLNVSSVNKVSRPAYNTGFGFFVDANGYFRDPNGYLYQMRGLNRVHYDSDSWAGPASGALASPNVVRVFMFDGQTAAFAANQVQTQYAPNNIFTILTLSGIGGTGTTGGTNPATITSAVNLWNGYYSTLSPVMNNIAINIANEWGPSAAGSGQTIKWNPGNYLLSDNFGTVGGAGGTNAAEINMLATTGTGGAWTGSHVLGYAPQYRWGDIETALNTYAIASIIVADFNYLQSKCPGAHFCPILFYSKQANMTGAQAPQGLPGYLTTNVGTYGAGADGSHSGYWVSQWDAGHSWYNICTAAMWRPAVQARISALFAAVANFSFVTTSGPYSGQTFTFNTHPLIEAVLDGSELSYGFNSGGTVGAPPDYTSTAYYTQYNAYLSTTAQVFTQTSFAPFQSFGINPTAGGHTSYADLATMIGNDVTFRLALANSDVLADASIVSSPATSTLSWAQKLYIGLVSSTNDGASGNWVSGGTDYRGTMAFMANIQGPDYDHGGSNGSVATTNGPQLIQNACLQTLKCSHIFWCSQAGYSGNPGISYFSTYVVPVINANPNTITTYPSNYPVSGSTVWRDTYITAVASLRSAGYTCPLVIDTGSSGEDPNDILNYSVAVNNSDPLKNCIFSIHPYAAALPWEAIIQSVTKGNPTVLTLNSNWSVFPLNPGASTAGSNNFNFNYQITEAAGLPSLNGIYPSDNKTYGSQNNWQVRLSVDSTGWVGNYIANSAHIFIATSTSSRNVDYRYLCSQLAALRLSGVCSIVGEFGPGNQSGNVLGATQQLNFQETTPGEFISACESYGIGWLPWAWDDHSGTNTLFAPNYFNMVYAVGPGYGKYTKPSDLTAFGLDIVGNPRYGTWTLSQPAPIYLPIIFQLTDQAGNILVDQGSTIITG